MSLTHIIGEGPPHAVKDKPALLPRLDFATHLDQVALAHLLGEHQVIAAGEVMAGGLDVQAQVKFLLAVGQVAGHGACLRVEHKGLLVMGRCRDLACHSQPWLPKAHLSHC